MGVKKIGANRITIMVGVTCIILSIVLAGLIISYALVLNNKDSKIANLQTQIDTLEQQIDSLQNSDIANLTTQITEKDNQIANLNNQIVALNSQIDSLQTHATALSVSKDSSIFIVSSMLL
jgi:peptidoglycan hydrolase CwlO-like protein